MLDEETPEVAPAGRVPLGQTTSADVTGALELTSFVGRQQDVTEVTRLIAGSRLVTITGIGGVGKTRLARRVAEEISDSWPDGIWFIDLAAVSSRASIAERIMSTVGLDTSDARGAHSTLEHFLAGRELLIILDNCDHLRDKAAVLVDRLLQHAPGLRFLTTSRHTLGVPGEHVYRLTPLNLPIDPEHSTVADIPRYEALELFWQRAQAVRPELKPTDRAAPRAAMLCTRLDGIPLAIELAAARMSALSIDDLLERIQARFDLLFRESPTALPRHRTLRELVAWSWDLCSSDERSIWSRTSAFLGSFDLAAAEAICDDGSLQDTVVEGLTTLVEKSIVTVVDDGESIRYRLLETLRSYGELHLDDDGDRAATLERHREWFAGLAAAAERDWFSADQEVWLKRLRREHDNVRLAVETSLAHPRSVGSGLRLVTDLWFYWIAAGRTNEARGLLTQGIATATPDEPERARTMEMLALFCLQQDDVAAARPFVEEAWSTASCRSDPVRRAWAMQLRGMLAMCETDFAGAKELLEKARASHLDNGDVIATVDTTFFLGSVCTLLGEFDAAERYYRDAIATSEQRGERWTREYMIWGLALVSWRKNDLPAAREHAREALRLAARLNELWALAFCIELLAWVATEQRHDLFGATLMGVAETLWHRVGWYKADLPLYYGIRDLTEDHQRSTTALRQRLGPGAYQQARATGAALSVDDAIATALASGGVAGAESETRPDLTRRENDVAELIADGLSNKQIAARLTIAQRTAEANVERLLTKLGFASRTQIAAWIVERRLTDRG